MDAALLRGLCADAHAITQHLCASRQESFGKTECDVLSAMCLVIPGARLTAVIVSHDNPDRRGKRSWGSMSVENYAIRMPGDTLWGLLGPLDETTWKDQACIELSEVMAMAGRAQDGPFRLEIDRSVGVDDQDPRVIEALDAIHPRYQAALAAAQLEAATPRPSAERARRL